MENQPSDTCQRCQSVTVPEALYWCQAESQWDKTGDMSMIVEGIQSGKPIPAFARQFIAELLSGQIKRGVEMLAARNRYIRASYRRNHAICRQWRQEKKLLPGQMPSDLAKDMTARQYGLSVDSVIDILKKKQG